MAGRVKRTAIQKEIMSYVMIAMDEGIPENYETLLVKLSYKPTYDALRVSLRFLEQHGMLTRIRNGKMVELFPTAESYYYFRKVR